MQKEAFGKYRLIDLLGKGGMADVYEAEETGVGRRVALKILPLAFARDEERTKRFAKEIQACAQLDHPNIVSVFDVGEVDHLHYYTMSVLPGGDLKSRLTEGALPSKIALRITREIASALHYAHGKGFVHRDVKPENILFGEDDRAVLTDFGIARATTAGTRMTATGLSIGTPHYMSPEQARGQEVDGRSDLYALGVVLHEMLTGDVPFDATDSLAIGIMHLQDPIPRLRPMLARYQRVIDHLLAKEPDDRYQTGQELIEDLDRIERGEKPNPRRTGTRIVKQIKEQGARRKEQGSKDTDHGEQDQGSRRAALYWGLGGAALAAVLGIGIYHWQNQQISPPPIGGDTTTVAGPALDETIGRADDASPTTDHRPPTGAATLHVYTTPDGAEVFLNDHRLGFTPFQSDELPAGEHRLRVVHRYYEPWEQTLRLEDNVIERIETQLQRGSGRVTVITDPPRAKVWINDQLTEGTTPLTLSDLQSGDQVLEIRLARYRTKTQEVEILPGETAQLNLQLDGGDLHEIDGRWLTGDEVVPLLLDAAESDFVAGRLMQPEGDNAWEKFQRVLVIRPDHQQATAGLQDIAERYVELAEVALDNNQFDRAGNLLANAQRAGPEGGRYERADNRLQQARERHRAEQRHRQLITDIQRELARLNREISPDGNLSGQTVEAIRTFERATNHRERGEATEQLLAQLRATDRWPASRPGEIFQDCAECPEMVVIPSGRFRMGSPPNELDRRDSESPQVEVHIKSFALGATPVTFAQWDTCVSHGGCTNSLDDQGWGRGERPVISVAANDVQQFLDWLGDHTGNRYRLPSESEWEYAARAGSSTRFNTGDCLNTDRANFDGRVPATSCPKGIYRGTTNVVRYFDSNPWGLFDIHGNVAELVADCWNRTLRNMHSDGAPLMSGNCNQSVIKGGSWADYGSGLRAARRGPLDLDRRLPFVGFRVARSIDN